MKRKVKKNAPAKKSKSKAQIMKKSVKKTLNSKNIKKKSLKGKIEPDIIGFEEVTIVCPCCGRSFTIVKSSGFSTEGMLCQRCSVSGGVTDFGDDDF